MKTFIFMHKGLSAATLLKCRRTCLSVRRFLILASLFFTITCCTVSCSQLLIPFSNTYEKVVLCVPEMYRNRKNVKNKPGSFMSTGGQEMQYSHEAYLLYIDENNRSKKLALTETLKEINLVLPKNRVTPFLFYTGEYDTHPFGCIYPYSTVADNTGGLTAFILYRLFILSQNGNEIVYDHISRFNWAKLKAVIDGYEDPWELDLMLITEKIAEGKLNSGYIKKKKF